MKTAVIFDLGNTLVAYHTRASWPPVLYKAIDDVVGYLRERGLLHIDLDELQARVEAQRREPPDHQVLPLEGRLARIFDLSETDLAGGVTEDLCRVFLAPTFAVARRYDDTLPVLTELRRRGLKLGILSNLPWGSPADPWRAEVDRHGLLNAVDAVVFCRDAGYRKPAPNGFELIMTRLGASADECLFVGDDPRWDLVGPQAVGMDAVLIDRTGSQLPGQYDTICNLTELLDRFDK